MSCIDISILAKLTISSKQLSLSLEMQRSVATVVHDIVQGSVYERTSDFRNKISDIVRRTLLVSSIIMLHQGFNLDKYPVLIH